MDNDNKSKASEEDLLTGTIQLLAGKTKADPNPDELEKLKRLIKKNVPFTLRSYFMAYLLREMLNANSPKIRQMAATQAPAPAAQREPKVAKPRRAAKSVEAAEAEQNPTQEKKTPEKRVEKPLPEGAKTLYLNIGKMKRLYAKELSLLLQKELEITREDIFSLRIHDKYSFISMSEENCEKAIVKLNGMDIKGRTAAVSYSNKE
ncbi:DbpA RNA binding domain-containing protein [Sphaerochaeta sp. PS]|uniref:DbpA RNA binding domain-containing protein n=1 Tax=Sphaerochaeta sp. PS TaxID=3076336 RepID=UPI0028A37186|nr:DbpA RNA binding domain-containing protein [Sphaerochaeta sp. PS]MDT4761966.1 DbpA RNA binding domain-containing protein [Sphaerochaeta sp. PS]